MTHILVFLALTLIVDIPVIFMIWATSHTPLNMTVQAWVRACWHHGE